MSVAENLMVLFAVFASEVTQKTCMLRTRPSSRITTWMSARQNCSIWKGFDRSNKRGFAAR